MINEFNNAIEEVHHFYWCLLVSILIKKKNGELKRVKDINKHVLCWVRIVDKRGVFHECVDNEIKWLVHTVKKSNLLIRTDVIVENIITTISKLKTNRVEMT